ncbi:MAG: ABC transporter permease [Chloroflexota bacterium]
MTRSFPWKRALGKKTIWISLLVILGLGLIAALAPWIAPHDPYAGELTLTRLPPVWAQKSPTPAMASHILGTDRYGRDILSRLLYGTRTAFFLALTAVPLAALIGTLTGLIAGYKSGWFDDLFMLFAEMLQTLPGLMLLVIIVLIMRGLLTPTWLNGLLTLVVGFTVISWASLARLVRVNVLLIRSQLFMEAATALGSSPWQKILRHLLPNIRHVVIVWIINNIPLVILLEALLGYIGVSVTSAVEGGEFTVVSWGGIFFTGRSALSSNPLMLIIPSICILLLSMSFYLLGDFLNTATRPE